MKLKNVLIVVEDIEKSKAFYKELFGLDVVVDFDGNVILTEGLVLQDKKIWEKFIEREVIPKGNDVEQARTVVDIKAELEKIREQTQNIE